MEVLMPQANTVPIHFSDWDNGATESKSFSRITWSFLAITLIFSFIVKVVTVPELTREQKSKVPPQLTKIIERVKIEQKPKIEPKPIEEEKHTLPDIKQETQVKEKPKPVEKQVPVLTQKQKVDVAREQAKKSGLLAMQDDLAQLREIAQMSTPSTEVELSTQGSQSAISESAPTGEIFAIKATTLDSTAVSQTVGKRVDLAARKLTTVAAKETNVADGANEDIIQESQIAGGRDVESIRKVLDRNKGAFYTIYRRALRKDPSLEGRVDMLIVVAPDGRVASCSIISSELNDEALERKLLARVKLINFGEQKVQETSINYSFNFLPF